MERHFSYKLLFWIIWIVIVLACAFYIVYKACWFIGDDAIVILHTGFGIPFSPADTVSPVNGRFFPLAYLVYNILPVILHGPISAQSHYLLHAIFFIIFALSITNCSLITLNAICKNTFLRYTISLLFSIICMGRVIANYLECYSTIWFDYTLVAIFLWALVSYDHNHKLRSYSIAVLSISVLVYCLEINFIIPLALGVIGILVRNKENYALFFILLFISLLFLILYGIIVLPRIENAYDPSHGEQVGFISNAIRMFWAQKIMVVALPLGLIRLFFIIKDKLSIIIYDMLFVSAFGLFAGGCLLRLNWTLYFTLSSLIIAPCLLYYSILYLRDFFTVSLFISLCVLYGAKIPKSIERNQEHRALINNELSTLLCEINEGRELVWYSPDSEKSFDTVLRDWRHKSLCANIGWHIRNMNYTIASESSYSIDNRIWLTCTENEKLFPEDDLLHENCVLVFQADDVYGYLATKE